MHPDEKSQISDQSQQSTSDSQKAERLMERSAETRPSNSRKDAAAETFDFSKLFSKDPKGKFAKELEKSLRDGPPRARYPRMVLQTTFRSGRDVRAPGV